MRSARHVSCGRIADEQSDDEWRLGHLGDDVYLVVFVLIRLHMPYARRRKRPTMRNHAIQLVEVLVRARRTFPELSQAQITDSPTERVGLIWTFTILAD